ncbi:MAG: glutamine synthetase family protein, partial [Aggregatilineales bacterium]
IALWFTDILGVVKSVMIPAAHLQDVIEQGGVHFDGSSIEGFARVAESDMQLMPDLQTFTILPWHDEDNRTARLICSVERDGKPFVGDPRNALLRALKRAEKMGLRFNTGMELEFFLFYRDSFGKPVLEAPHDFAGYFDMSEEPALKVRRHMLSTLEDMCIEVISSHSETGSGQHEIDFQYNHALVSADHVLTARVALKTIARSHDLHCTFMPRPIATMPGSGMHTHQSLHDNRTGENLFSNKQNGLSELASQFLAGQLTHARAMSAILSPLVNSYKRLGTSFEAPVYVTWAHVNRGALIRVPAVRAGKENHTRLELRCPDPSANPYLASTVMLMAGLDGIQQKMSLPEPLEETLLQHNRGRLRHIATLPESLGEALDAMAADDVVLDALGDYISNRYIETRRQEFDDYNRQVTEWELSRYLNRF